MKSAAGGGPFKNATDEDNQRMIYAAMTTYLDDNIKYLTEAWKAKDGGAMWKNTLVLFFSDNGGPLYGTTGGNNFPMRGGKYSEFEGGVRVNAFVSGGLIPTSKRGTISQGLVAIADVYTTLCALAGADPTDHTAAAAGLPAVDGIDFSPMLLDETVEVSDSKRTEIQLMPLSGGDLNGLDAYDVMLAMWTAEQALRGRAAAAYDVYPNATCKNDNSNRIALLAGVNTIEACEANCTALAACLQFQWKRVVAAGKSHKCTLFKTAGPAHVTKNADAYACGCKGTCPGAPPPSPGPGPGPKPPKVPTCWKVDSCGIPKSPNGSMHKGVTNIDCCDMCDKAPNGTCQAAWFIQDPKPGYTEEYSLAKHIAEIERNAYRPNGIVRSGGGGVGSGTTVGTCIFKPRFDVKDQIIAKDGTCFFPSRENPPPVPIIHGTGGLIIGNMKILTGDDISMSIFTGPQYPNVSTPYGKPGAKVQVPGFACSTPLRRACLFNVSADPTEHHDLSAEQPDVVHQMLNLLVNRSRTAYNPDRGVFQEQACIQGKGPWRGFYGPWLELESLPTA